MLEKTNKILIAGAHGMVGKALVKSFAAAGYSHLLTPSRQELDYTDQKAVRTFLQTQKPDLIVVAAAKVGGIWANMTYPAEFIYNNLTIACNLIHEAHNADIGRLLYLGSSCIYPRCSSQPIHENALLTGPLEETNEAYALAKIAGVKMCQHYRRQYGRRYICAMPTNLYGPNDNYHYENSHVVPALIRRFHEAKVTQAPEIKIWGSGRALREFLYVEDLARACLHLTQCYDEQEPINVGSSDEVSISELASMIADVVGYAGTIAYDPSRPEGVLRKKIHTGRINALGWKPLVALRDGLAISYADYLARLIT